MSLCLSRMSAGQVVLLAGFLLGMPAARGQRVTAASSGRITGVSSSGGVDAIARGTGGQSSGLTSFAVSEGAPTVVTGKIAGYGARMGRDPGEAVFMENAGVAANVTNLSPDFETNKDFPVTDFVGTMPRLNFTTALSPGGGSPGSEMPGSGFGVTLSTGIVPSRNAFSGLGSHHATTPQVVVPHPKMKDPDAILNPFTHSIGAGLDKPIGVGLGSAR